MMRFTTEREEKNGGFTDDRIRRKTFSSQPRSSRTTKSVYKPKPVTTQQQIKDFVIPQPGDPNRLRKGLNNIRNFGMPSGQNNVKKKTPINVKIKPEEKPKEPFKPETKKEVEKQMINLGVPPAPKKAGIKLDKNMIIYGVIGLIVLILLVNIKR